MKRLIFTITATLVVALAYAQLGIGTTTPNSTLDVRGSIATSYRAFTTSTTVTATDNLLVFTGAGAATITMPSAIGCEGRAYMIKNASTTGPTPVLTIATTLSQTVDGTGSWALSAANETITVISNGANWNVSAQSLPGGSGTTWTQNGNSVAAVKSIGTISNYALPFITNNTERMRIDVNGKVGIGTNAIPVGTIGAAKLALDGASASLNGPHVQFTTSADSYPLAQYLNWTHDAIYNTYDAYFDGGWKSSTSAGGNFVAGKEGGKYLWQYAAVNTPGSAITWSNGLSLTNTGKVGVGTSSFNATNPEKLLVDAGTTTSVNAIVAKGSIDSYLQLNIQNASTGTNASSDIVATANNGSETTNYVDLGINGSNYSGGVMGGANDSYLYNLGQNFLVGTGTAAKSLIFMTGGTTQATNERMRIDGTGNVGIGNNNPTSTFAVTGSRAYSITTKTGNYLATANDYCIICNNAGAVTISLPAASGAAGRVYVIKKISGILNNVVIDPNASETIDGVLTRTLGLQYESVVIQSDGSNWFVLSKL